MKQDNLTVITHPLVKAKITQMRDKNTTTKEFGELVYFDKTNADEVEVVRSKVNFVKD